MWGRSGVGATFNPDFPAGSPYVTAVGGTDFSTKSTIGAESVWSCGGGTHFFSKFYPLWYVKVSLYLLNCVGGFSDTFSIPSWQADVVAEYLSAASAAGVLPSSSLFNSTGRAYPDVAALG